MYFKDIGQIFVNFSAPLQPFWIFLSWVTLCDLCGHFEYHKPIFYDKFFFGSPLSWGRLRLQKSAKMRMFLKHFGIFLTWFLFTCVSHIFDLSGKTKYELLCFTTRLTAHTNVLTWGFKSTNSFIPLSHCCPLGCLRQAYGLSSQMILITVCYAWRAKFRMVKNE